MSDSPRARTSVFAADLASLCHSRPLLQIDQKIRTEIIIPQSSDLRKLLALTLIMLVTRGISKLTEETYMGRIEISPKAIAGLTGQSVVECYGVVGMANKNLTDGIAEILPGETLSTRHRRQVGASARLSSICTS